MSTNTRILLPLYVRADRVAEVVGKVVGTPFVIKTLDSRAPAQEIHGMPEPCGEGHCWHLVFPRRPDFGIQPNADLADISFGQLRFTDLAETTHEWSFHAEVEEEDGKMLHPGSHGLGAAVGRRLVDFFGGRVDYHDLDNPPSYKKSPRRAKYPTKTPGQSSDDRFYQFYNTLLAEPLLTSDELRQGAALSSCGEVRECEEKLIAVLDIANAAQELAAATPLASARRRAKRL